MGIISRAFAVCLAAGLALGTAAGSAGANPAIVVDAATGRVLHAEEATRPWYPASLSKLMTFYTVVRAIQAGRIDGGTPIVITPRAARQAPSKMGYPVGTMVTVDDALKMLVVHSANDIAVALAENVSGSVDAFAGEMNAYSRALGMTQSHWVNPNGLPDPRQVTSARDMAIIADAIITQFPQYDALFQIQTIQSGKQVMRTHNALVYRYPGTDGMKTGFICAAGFNVVATAVRNGRKLITVIMGAATPNERTNQAVALFEANFNNTGGGFFTSAPRMTQLPPSRYSMPTDIRDIACSPRKGGSAAAENADTAEVLPGAPQTAGPLLASWVMAPPIVVGPYTGPRRPPYKFADAPILVDLPPKPAVTKMARHKPVAARQASAKAGKVSGKAKKAHAGKGKGARPAAAPRHKKKRSQPEG